MNAKDKKQKGISVVIPVYNESDSIISLLKEIEDTLFGEKYDYEIILVNDGSTDNISKIIKSYSNKKPIKMLHFSKNNGQSAALHYGIISSAYELVVTLDADGQNVPADIPNLIKHARKGRVCSGIRINRRDYMLRRFFSKTARKILNILLGFNAMDPGCTLKVFHKEDFRKLPFFNGFHRFLPYLFHYYDIEIIQIPVQHRARIAGKSKYKIWSRTFRVILDTFGLLWLKKRTKNYYKDIE